jgi:hypothetical protein
VSRWAVGRGVSVGGSCVNGLGSAETRSHSGARVLWFGDVEWKGTGVDVRERPRTKSSPGARAPGPTRRPLIRRAGHRKFWNGGLLTD